MSKNVLYPEDGYDLISPTYDERDWANFWAYIELPKIKKWLENNKDLRDLADCGCGTAPYCNTILKMKKNYIGVDISSSMLRIAVEKHPIQNAIFKKGSILALPFDDEAIGLILCNRTLSHISSVDKAMDEFNRVLKIGGSCLITDIHPLHKYDHTSFDTNNHEKIYIQTFKHTLQELEVAAKKNGFTVKSTFEITSESLSRSFKKHYNNLIRDKGKYFLIGIELIKL